MNVDQRPDDQNIAAMSNFADFLSDFVSTATKSYTSHLLAFILFGAPRPVKAAGRN